MNKRKYWVQFKLVVNGKVGDGAMEVTRELPITGEEDVLALSIAIKKALCDTQGLPQETTIQIVGWTKFEEPSVLLAHSLPKTS